MIKGRITDTGFSMADLHSIAQRLVIEAPHATLERAGDFFVMRGPRGTHSLSVSATDSQRLWTHWKGFKQIAADVTRRP
jgi:hypothetical protein